MEIQLNFLSIFFTFINIAFYTLIILGIVKGFKIAKSFINKINKMDKKIDTVLEKLEE